ncbi:MAG: hypothetical protein E3J72_11395 [Planctomycetota bacterium]|nr:MAG: hypothetical protein E3J72_11395 [Planctomycetota bacterium]
MPTEKIDISEQVNIRDGGIDGIIGNVPDANVSDLIPTGDSILQIKTGDTFNPKSDYDLAKELFGPTKANRDNHNLKPGIRKYIEEGATYILVCFGASAEGDDRDEIVTNLKRLFNLSGHPNVQVRVYTQNQLPVFFEQFPPLAIRITRRPESGFSLFERWEAKDEMQLPFIKEASHDETISAISEKLNNPSGPTHIRILGDPGIGKTRLALEAVRDERLKGGVLYTNASDFIKSSLKDELLLPSRNYSVVLVIDECDMKNCYIIWDEFKTISDKVQIITIYNEINESDRGTEEFSYIKCAKLSEKSIEDILKAHGITPEKARRWAGFCSGSPRVAHIFGQNYHVDPERIDVLRRSAAMDVVWDRYITGYVDSESEINRRKTILMYISLFKRFGYSRTVSDEARAIWGIIESRNSDISWDNFLETIEDLRAKKILQGEDTLYITPKALHIWLWCKWWDTYMRYYNHEEFTSQMIGKLEEWYNDMFQYAGSSEIAGKTVKKLLEDSGPFTEQDYLKTRNGSQFFLALTNADPKSALKLLKKTVGKWTIEELLELEEGRSNIIWALEKIVIYRQNFIEGGRILLRLAEAENQSWSNNASGVFAGLFTNGPGSVAPTQASPKERFPLLQEALDSSSKKARLLGLRACDSALNTSGFSRMVGAEHQGLRVVSDLWTPKTYKELSDSYKNVWNYLHSKLPAMEEDERDEGVRILLERSRGLLSIKGISDIVLKSLRELDKKNYANKKQLIATTNEIIRYMPNDAPKSLINKSKKLYKDIVGTGFNSRLHRYVGLNIFEDFYDEDGKKNNNVEKIIENLADEMANNQELFNKNIEWLLTNDAQNANFLGYSLARHDSNNELLENMLQKFNLIGTDANPGLIGGYLRKIQEIDVNSWENQLDRIANNSHLCKFLVEITISGSITDRSIRRILDNMKAGFLNIEKLSLLTYGYNTRGLAEELFLEITYYLLRSEYPKARSIVLRYWDYYYLDNKSKYKLPEKDTWNLLTHQKYLYPDNTVKQEPIDDYYWSKIALSFIENYKERIVELGRKFIPAIFHGKSIIGRYHNQTNKVITEIIKKFPEEMWHTITAELEKEDSRSYKILIWMQGDSLEKRHKSKLTLIPLDLIWDWIDKDPHSRARLIAEAVPNSLFHSAEKKCYAREVLARYGNIESVKSAMFSNFITGVYNGPMSAHYKGRKLELLEFLKNESNSNVIEWVEDHISYLDNEIERSRIEEEREF